MAICTFLGHKDIYDVEIDSMLQNAIERIVLENEKTAFLIFPCNVFYRKCFTAVLKAKARQPEKITLSLVLENYSKNQTDGIPICLIDNIIFASSGDCASMGHKKVIRRLIQQSTHLISCIYRNLYDQENHILDYAQNSPDLQIVDISAPDTAQEILQRTTLMSDRELFIFENLIGGSSPKDVSETLGISTNRLRQVLHHGCRAVRKSMQKRYAQLSAAREKARSICSIFSVGEITFESLLTLESIINFLLSQCEVTHFEISADDQHSGFMYVLKKYSGAEQIFYNTDAIQDGINTSMIDHSDFCVCNLSEGPFAEKIKAYILQAKRPVLVDMGQACLQMQDALS